MKYQVDEKGFYGDFGGAYIPEMLYPNCEELRQNYLSIMEEPSFKEEFQEIFTKMALRFSQPSRLSRTHCPCLSFVKNLQ